MNTPHHGNDLGTEFTAQMGKLEHWMEPLFAKFPHVPENGRKTLASIAPWLALIFGVLGVFAMVTLGFFSLLFSPFILLSGGGAGLLMFVAMAVGLIGSILDLLAFGPLRSRRKKGWNYLFYGSILGAVSTILGVLLGDSSIASLLFAVVGLWLLFEIRPQYR